jgi:predicted 3-demethylubiquinone-9 3-methyltransferase (glyoxalase superfamily)
MAKNTICIWYDKEAEAAARFYAETFPNSAVSAVHHAPGSGAILVQLAVTLKRLQEAVLAADLAWHGHTSGA